LLRRDSFGPLVCFRPDGPLLDDGVAHPTTMQRRPIDQEERFTSRLQYSAVADIERLECPMRSEAMGQDCCEQH
jgi:hypothetical protein